MDRVGVDYKVVQVHSVTTNLQYDVVYEIYNKTTETDCYHHTYFDYNGDFMTQKIEDRELIPEDYDNQYSID